MCIRDSGEILTADSSKRTGAFYETHKPIANFAGNHTILFKDDEGNEYKDCLLYTSDAADERSSVDLGGRRIIKKKKKKHKNRQSTY